VENPLARMEADLVQRAGAASMKVPGQLRPIEQARAFRVLMDRNGWSTHQVARELAVDQSSVVRALALLALPPSVQEHVERGTLSPATAYEISKVQSLDDQVALAERVVAEGMSRAETVEVIRGRKLGRKGKETGTGKVTSRVFRRVAGCTVTVENGRGIDSDRARAALVESLARLSAETGEGKGDVEDVAA
jgi:ParB family transcriptional regulator, chromosome partitioning protein